ncbi:YggS family pyridoxal phosphate-dependent enzyme [Helicobacter monodelphidis]|uniref:YggS family pyridoxal phosphate-dependent enzyme n=1 Tax=Helicobacter sp. 15-1451 TaxID=2004995 RepID=UPI000DCAEE8A|nr:YggS family pyridoxal phosphate-dependent enzyme [Helicobacter sp. 15-1451]RAX58573.1 YggS family pyridoxal phosphate-dependent enzyme [Helicobacter sp. 15-1451]
MLSRNLQEVIARIEKARIAYSRHHIVKIVAISKYHQVEEIRELYECGQRTFGENKVQDLKAKSEDLENLPLEWHFVGTLQSNKINALLCSPVSLIHSIHSLSIALELEKRLEREKKTLKALLQVNSANEQSKSGFSPNEALEKYIEILEKCPHLKLCGLMSIGAHSEQRSLVQKSFEITQRLFEELKPKGAEILSMGMSGDFEQAIACGSNLVRIGSLLFQKGRFL